MDTVEELNGTYFYEGHSRLTPDELFDLIFLDSFAQHFGLEINSALLILSGQPWFPTRGKPRGATPGTSLASKLSRRMFKDRRFPRGFRPYTPTGKSLSTLKFAQTNKIGAFVGRYMPWIGYVEALIIVERVAQETKTKYNLIARPKDRIQWTSF